MGRLQAWWNRRTCDHLWELVGRQKVMGALPTRLWGDTATDRQHLRVYRCLHCGATKREPGLE